VATKVLRSRIRTGGSGRGRGRRIGGIRGLRGTCGRRRRRRNLGGSLDRSLCAIGRRSWCLWTARPACPDVMATLGCGAVRTDTFSRGAGLGQRRSKAVESRRVSGLGNDGGSGARSLGLVSRLGTVRTLHRGWRGGHRVALEHGRELVERSSSRLRDEVGEDLLEARKTRRQAMARRSTRPTRTTRSTRPSGSGLRLTSLITRLLASLLRLRLLLMLMLGWFGWCYSLSGSLCRGVSGSPSARA
jgi:hypothetical protein